MPTAQRVNIHPLSIVCLGHLPEEQGRIKTLHHTISLGVVWGGVNLVNTRDLAKLSHSFRNEWLHYRLGFPLGLPF